jgi:hypothetical protein
MYKKALIICLIFVFVSVGSQSFAYIMGSEKNSVNFGVTLLGISLGTEFNITDRMFAGISFANGGSVFGGASSTNCYISYQIIKNEQISLSFSLEKLYIFQNDEFEALGAGISLFLPEENGRQKKLSIIPFISKANPESNGSFLSPSSGVQVSFPFDEESKWYVSLKPFLSPYSPAVFFWGIILNI